MIKDWTPPPCPKCGADDMYHHLASPIPTTKAFQKENGWYCGTCRAGAMVGTAGHVEQARFSWGTSQNPTLHSSP
jgi:hypothetical protein